VILPSQSYVDALEQMNPGTGLAVRQECLDSLRQRAYLGDARALLAHPDARAAIKSTYDDSVTKTIPLSKLVTRTQKSGPGIDEAKKLMRMRAERRRAYLRAKVALDGDAERLKKVLFERRVLEAITMAYGYHHHVKKLYETSDGQINWGRGGLLEKRRGHLTATTKGAGVRFDNDDNPRFIIIENDNNVEVARQGFPRKSFAQCCEEARQWSRDNYLLRRAKRGNET